MFARATLESPTVMPFAARVLVLCLLALSATGCGGSNNKGKIEGSWRFASVGDRPEAAKLRDATLAFGGDGMVMLHRPDLPKPAIWHYKLLAGDDADFYDFANAPDRAGLFPTTGRVVRVRITITITPGEKYERRDMTITDADGRELKLTSTRG
jgi:hypothetical protein